VAEAIFTNPAFDAERYAADLRRLAPADRRYLILFTPRCGSTWLCTALRSTRRHGNPLEYINEKHMPRYAAAVNAADRAEYLEMIVRKRKTPNGVFGIKATSIQIGLFGEDGFFDLLPAGSPIYSMWRQNIVAQAVSLLRAVHSRRFHSFQTADTAVADAPPPYDAEKVANWVRHILNIENRNARLLERRQLSATPICYEDIVGDRDAALAAFAAVADPDGRPAPVAAADPARPARIGLLEKLGDDWSGTVEARFRAENASFLAEIEARRLLLGGADPAPAPSWALPGRGIFAALKRRIRRA